MAKGNSTAGVVLAAVLAAALTVASGAASAEHKYVEGRTGLPFVKVGGEKVWMERGNVSLNVVGSNLQTVQEYRLHYPGPDLEKGPIELTVAVREDFYRARDNNGPEVTLADAKGFRSFHVWLDGRKVNASLDPWQLNAKKDTATRFRHWDIHFNPGEYKTVRIETIAPLGRDGNKRTVEFVTKDAGHWRTSPDLIEVRLRGPGGMESRLAGVEPKPADINSRAVRWVWRKANPDRDIFVMLPANYAHRSYGYDYDD